MKKFAYTPLAAATLLALGVIVYAPASYAVRFDLGNGIEGSFDTTLSVSAQMRAGEADCKYIGYDNGGCPSGSGQPHESSVVDQVGMVNLDDGNLNYDEGQVFSNTVRGVHDLYVTAPNDWTMLVRASWFKDYAVEDTERTDIDGHDDAVSDIELLDAYLDKGFAIGDNQANLRVGNQVINWGEALLTTGGINEANPLDVRKAFAAGVPLKELYIPMPMISFGSGITDQLSIQTFYEFGFEPNTLPASGTYFSTADVVGQGARPIYIGSPVLALAGLAPLNSIPPGTLGDQGTVNAIYGTRIPDSLYADPVNGPLALATGIPTGSIIFKGDTIEPGDDQFGFSSRYQFESGDQLGLYYMRYSEKMPALSFTVGATTDNPVGLSAYNLEYVGDRDLYGASYNFKLGDWSWGAELSYRPDQVISIDPTVLIGTGEEGDCSLQAAGSICHGFVENKKVQFVASGLQILQPDSLGGLVGLLGANEGTLLAELVAVNYPGLDLAERDTPIASAPLTETRVPYSNSLDYEAPTKDSGGVAMDLLMSYPNAFGWRATLSPQVALSHGVWGTSAQAFPGFSKDVGQVTAALNIDFRMSQSVKARIDYTEFYGGDDSNPMQDRDYFSASLSTSF